MKNQSLKPRKRVLFVCLGNICRSPAAQGVMQRIVDEQGDSAEWFIDSAGTGGYHIGDLPDRRMRLAARRRGLELDHICRQVRPADFDRFDVIVAMDESNYMNLRQMSPSVEGDRKIRRMAEFFGTENRMRYYAVPDPYYEGAEGFELVLDLLEDGCQNLYERIKTNTLD